MIRVITSLRLGFFNYEMRGYVCDLFAKVPFSTNILEICEKFNYKQY